MHEGEPNYCYDCGTNIKPVSVRQRNVRRLLTFVPTQNRPRNA